MINVYADYEALYLLTSFTIPAPFCSPPSCFVHRHLETSVCTIHTKKGKAISHYSRLIVQLQHPRSSI